MLVIKKRKGFQRVYNKETQEYVTLKYTGKDEDVYGNRVLEEDGKFLEADEREFEKLFIISSPFKQKAIALIEGTKPSDLIGLNINTFLKNPNNHVYFFNLNGEYITDVQGYVKDDSSSTSIDNLLAVNFVAVMGANSITLKRTLALMDKKNEPYFEERFYNYPLNRKEKDEVVNIK